jgi:sugar transferase (PEP-CTERM/EpsH1 system associated)
MNRVLSLNDPVLYLTHRVPYPPDKGDRIRNYHVLQQLAKRGPVWLGCLADEPIPLETVSMLKGLSERLAIIEAGRFGRWVSAAYSLATGRSISEGLFANSQLRHTIRSWTAQRRFRAVVASASSLVPYLRRDGLEKVDAVVDLVDVDSQKWLDYANAVAFPRRWLYRLEAMRIRKIEAELPHWARAVAVVSRAEADAYNSFAGQGTATVAANGVDLNYFRPTDHKTDLSCVFVGAMDYLPNVDGVVWFARSIWPAIVAKFPTAVFRIVGRKPTSAVEALSSIPGIEVTGSVADVRPFLATAKVAIVPLRLARGVQNKVLEALAMGKAVVASPPAIAGLSTVPSQHLLMATTPVEWIDAVGGLFTNPERCRKLGIAGRQYVEQYHRWEHCLEPLLEKIYNAAAGLA